MELMPNIGFDARKHKERRAVLVSTHKRKLPILRTDTLLLEASIALFFFGALTLGAATVRAESLEIGGRYVHVFSNGAAPKTNRYNFHVRCDLNGWSLSVTNANQPKEWGTMLYKDGNLYTLEAHSLNGYRVFGYVYAGEWYVPEAQDPPYLFFPWMTFFLKPQMIQAIQRKDERDMPCPWGRRYSLMDYGFKWMTDYSEDGLTVDHIEVVRDVALDLKSDEEELRRLNLNFGFEYSSREHRLETLYARKNVPQGFIRATYEGHKVCQTNGWHFPCEASFAEYWPSFRDSQPASRLVFEMALHVERIGITQGSHLDAVALAKAQISDYRFQRTNDRTKFNKASYVLDAGQPFPHTDDPKLVAEADQWLRHGPGYTSFQSKRIKILVGISILTVGSIAVLVFWLKSKKTNPHSHPIRLGT